MNSIRLRSDSRPNDGKEAAKAGEVLKDDQLQTMNYYVDGVIGKVPN